MQSRENGSATPEQAVAKPPSIIKQIVETLTPRTEGENADLFIAGITDPMYWVEMYVSPLESTFDIDALNAFRDTLLTSLRARINDHDQKVKIIKDAKIDNGTIVFPSILYGPEVLGKRITTAQFDMSDTLLPEQEPTLEAQIIRNFTSINVYPNPKVAEFAEATRQHNRLPEGFNVDILWEITQKQIRMLDKAVLKPRQS